MSNPTRSRTFVISLLRMSHLQTDLVLNMQERIALLSKLMNENIVCQLSVP